jgi:PilZ domain
MNDPNAIAESFDAAAAASEAQRIADRDSLLMIATLRFPSSKEEGDVRIRNLSAGGLMAEAPLRVARGEKIEIKLRNIGWISGNVAWVAEGRIGIAFDHPINPKDARKPAAPSADTIPRYLQRLNAQNQAPDPKRLRPV